LKKTTILKGYSLDEAKYKRICGVLDLDEDEIPSVMMDDFEMVLGWFAADKAMSDADAKKRYDEIQESREDETSPFVHEAVQAASSLVEQEMRDMVAKTPEMIDRIKRQYFAGIVSIAGNVLQREMKNMKPAYPVLIEDNQPALPKGNG
jgi:hypothetical protein